MGKSRSLNIFLGGMLAIAVFAFAVTASPAGALAKGKWKVPPGQMKKMATFNIMGDVQGGWAAEPVTAMQKLGIIKGYPDGNFYPRREVTKSQALVMVMRALGFEGQEPTGESLDLVGNSPAWARDTVALALDKGIITRQEIRDFAGDLPAQRYEVAVWIARAVRGGDVAGGGLTFADAGQIPEYARNYVAYMASHGIMKGYPGNMFKPLHPVQRAEIAAMLFRCQNIYSLNPKFNYLKGEVAEVLPADPAFVILATGGDSRIMVQVADDAAIFVDGEAAELEDVEEGCAVSMVLNPARKAVVVSARTEGDVSGGDEDEEEDENAPVIEELQPGDGDTVDEDIDELTVRFNEEVRWVDEDYEGNTVLVFETDTNNMIIPDEVDLDDDELIIKFDEDLDDGEYSVTIPAGVIEDLSGNKFNGIGVNDWVFEVE